MQRNPEGLWLVGGNALWDKIREKESKWQAEKLSEFGNRERKWQQNKKWQEKHQSA